MADEKFSIGDKVIYLQTMPGVIKKGRECEIVGDKTTPYKFGHPAGDIFPTGNTDFVLAQIFTPKDREENVSFLPLVHALKRDLQHVVNN